ncbi:hypothetical protein K1719_027622 [Acacia pycnantha]|nr:hypothetical protein K1719_027622 [Acacia pycnantha]
MNEEEPHGDQEESDEEDNLMKTSLDGKPGKLWFSAEEYTTWCLPWMNSLIIKVLGANFPTYVIRNRINRMWHPKDALKLIPLTNGYYVVSFSNKEDREYAFKEGPWMIEDHYLIVQRWRPNFNPWKVDLQCVIAAWVRLPDVPFEFYNVESLRRIGNMIGKMIKVDRSTSIYDKGGFARICVEIDLKKPLLPTYLVFGEERPIVYEGLHNVCFSCGKYGHQKADCPMNKSQNSSQVPEQDNINKETGGNGETRKEKINRIEADGGKWLEKDTNAGITGRHQTESSTGVIGGISVVTSGDDSDDSPFGKIKVLRRDFRGSLNGKLGSAGLRKGDHDYMMRADFRGSTDGIQILRRGNGKNEALTDLNLNKKDLVKDKGLSKSEWVSVGNKRKNDNKGKVKGKENKPHPSKGLLVFPLWAIVWGPLIPIHLKCCRRWRPRGTGAKSFPALVRDLKSHYHMDFIAIVETRCAKEASIGRAS